MIDNLYHTIMKALFCHPECSLYALVDGLQYERHFGCEIKPKQGISYPFFNTLPDSRVAFAGPWLIRLNSEVYQRERLVELSTTLPSVSWILSPLTTEELLVHFKHYCNLQLPDGRCALFRFYDPRVLEGIESLLDEKDFRQLINGVKEWFFILNNELCDVKNKMEHYNAN